MNSVILYWHWLVAGMVLIMAELFMPSFTIFWFGLGALLVGLILWMIPSLALSVQLLGWALASCLFTLLWFKLIRPRMIDRTTAGLSREAVLGETGQVVKVPAEDRRGTVRFGVPLLGSDEWPIICEKDLALGDRVRVIDIAGNTLIVDKQ